MNESPHKTRRRFASLLELYARARVTFVRFPLSILSAILAAAVAHYIVEYDVANEAAIRALWPLVMVAVLGIPLFYALRVLGASRGWPRRIQLGMALAGLAALVIYYLILPTPVKGADVVNYLLLLAGVVLASTFLPFLGRPGRENGFWQYNRVMLLRLAAAALFSLVLFAGLSLAVGACDVLLGFDVDPETYAQLWYWVLLAYGSWFFFAGIPEDVLALQDVRDYPGGLRVFSQYVLIPLVALYFVILYAYTVKIIVQWELPDGWVGFPVIGVSVSGLLALLLVYPIRDQAENKWIAPYAKFFFWALYPLIVLISVAIWTRISEYGITEKRYLVVGATVWLLGIALYFTFRRRGDIRVIPISLCLVCLLAAFGPWGATAFARRSQLGRLRDMLIAEQVMVDGALERTKKRIPFEREKQISDIVQYVISYHGADRIRSWYAARERLPDGLTAPIAVREMGLDYISRRQEEPEGFAIDASVPNPVPVAGFDYVYDLDRFDLDSARWSAALDDATELYLDGTALQVGRPGDPASRLNVDLAPMLIELRERAERGESYGREQTVLEAENPRYRLVLYLRRASGGGEGDSLAIERLRATVLVTAK